MNRWKIAFIFLTGFMLREVIAHLWLSLDGVLPYTSRLFFGLTITEELNQLILAINFVLLLVCAYLAFLNTWQRRVRI